MSTYEEICKQRCEWCAADRTGLGNHYHCTAPTKFEVIEEQAAEIARLLGLIAEMEHGHNCQSHQSVCSVCKVPVMDHPPFIEVIDEVLVQHAICPDFEWTPLPCDCLKSKAVKS